MRKRVRGKQLGRDRGSRKALFRSLVDSIVISGHIETTKEKAQAVIGDIDRLVRLATEDSVKNRRRVYAKLGNDKKITDQLFGRIGKAFKSRKSGFVRMINLNKRKGDNAQMVRLEWVKDVDKRKENKKGTKETNSEKNSKDKKKTKK